MKKELGFEIFEEEDKGVFWILYEDALSNFHRLNMNWNPNLLPYQQARYGQWKKEDLIEGYNDLSKNPQFTLAFDPQPDDPKTHNSLYVVLSKMVVDDCFNDDGEEEEGYQGVDVYRNDKFEGLVLETKNQIVNNSASNELTYAFKMKIDDDLLDKCLNLVVMQSK